MTSNDKVCLDNLRIPLDIVIKGQNELGLDYIDVADYMIHRGISKESINVCFSVWAGEDIQVI